MGQYTFLDIAKLPYLAKYMDKLSRQIVHAGSQSVSTKWTNSFVRKSPSLAG